MDRLTLLFLLTCIFTSGCISGPAGNSTQGSDGTVNVTEASVQMTNPEPQEKLVPNSTTIGNVTLSFDRPVFMAGERARGKIFFNGNLSVNPMVAMEKLENETWIWSGYYSLNGGAYGGYGTFPSCEKLGNSENSMVVPSMAQNASTGANPGVTRYTNITTFPLVPGIYRITVGYGFGWYCRSESITAGFTIR